MREHQFEYGPVSCGIYSALIWVTLILPFLSMKLLGMHILLLLFLGFGLRPLLERTGLYRSLCHFQILAIEKSSEKFMAQRKFEIERKRRDDGLRKRHVNHSDLPKNW